MCIDAPESTTISLSSGTIVDSERGHQVSESEEECCFMFLLQFQDTSCYFSTLLHGHIALAFQSLLETDPQILGHWACPDEDHLGKLFKTIVFGLECWRDVTRLC